VSITTPDDLQLLERCASDLIALLALPASWRGQSVEHVLGTLSEALLRTLRLTFICARIDATASTKEVLHVEVDHNIDIDPVALGAVLAPWGVEGQCSFVGSLPNPLQAGRISLVSLHFGLQERLGTLVTAASREDYPSELEMLLLRVAVSQASVALHERAGPRLGSRATAELETHVTRRIGQLTDANRELGHLKDTLAAELGAMARLHEFSRCLLALGDLQAVLEQTLTEIMELQSADFGTVQLTDAEQGGLVIVAQRNFQPAFLHYFALVRDGGSVCARAAGTHCRVVVEDVQTDEFFAPHRHAAVEAGFRAVQSTPLLGQRGELLGVVSTHFRRPHRPSEAELRLTDLYARLATQTIERKLAEDERSKLASIVENSSDFIGIASLAGKCIFINAAGRKMVGLTIDEPVGDYIRSYVAAEDRERLAREIMPAVERSGFWDGELSLRHLRTGASIPVLQHVFHMREPQTGRPLALATVCRDITERRRAEHAASKAQQDLAHAARVLSIGAMTTSIAHEINQPLAAIVANGNACRRWIERDVPAMSEARASLNSIVRDANRASDVIQRIRAFSTKSTLSRALLNVNDVVRDVLSLTSTEMLHDQIELDTCLSDTLPRIIADRVELQQVVLNLVMNSIEAMRSVVGRPHVLLIASRQRNATEIEVSVRDSGSAVDAQQLPRLFEPFFTTKPQGMGLGLSISRRIIESHGGQLRASPNPDWGLSLSFTLPMDGKRHE
jgi:PAS domain S-box-containing protein